MPVFQPRRDCPGMESMGMSSSPSCTKMGYMKLAGVKIVCAPDATEAEGGRAGGQGDVPSHKARSRRREGAPVQALPNSFLSVFRLGEATKFAFNDEARRGCVVMTHATT